MLVCPHMAGLSSLGDDSSVRPFGSVGVDLEDAAVGFVFVFALLALATGEALGSHADPLTFFDEGYFGPDSDGCADDF